MFFRKQVRFSPLHILRFSIYLSCLNIIKALSWLKGKPARAEHFSLVTQTWGHWNHQYFFLCQDAASLYRESVLAIGDEVLYRQRLRTGNRTITSQTPRNGVTECKCVLARVEGQALCCLVGVFWWNKSWHFIVKKGLCSGLECKLNRLKGVYDSEKASNGYVIFCSVLLLWTLAAIPFHIYYYIICHHFILNGACFKLGCWRGTPLFIAQGCCYNFS